MNKLDPVTRILVEAEGHQKEFESSQPYGVSVIELGTVPTAVWVKGMLDNLEELSANGARVADDVQAALSDRPSDSAIVRRKHLHRARALLFGEVWYHAANAQAFLCELQASLWRAVAFTGRERRYLDADLGSREWLHQQVDLAVEGCAAAGHSSQDDLRVLAHLLDQVPDGLKRMQRVRSRIELYAAGSRLAQLTGRILLSAPAAHAEIWRLWQDADDALEAEAKQANREIED